MFTGCFFFMPHTKQLILTVVSLNKSRQTYMEQICLQNWENGTHTFLTDRCQAKVSWYLLCFLRSVDFPHSGEAFQILKTLTQSKTKAGWLTTRTLYWESAFPARLQGSYSWYRFLITQTFSKSLKTGRFTDRYRAPLIPSKFSISYR